MLPSNETLKQLASGMEKLNGKVSDLENIFKRVLPALEENNRALKDLAKAIREKKI